MNLPGQLMGSCVHTCSDVYSTLNSIINLGDLNSPTDGTERHETVQICLLSITTVMYPVLQNQWTAPEVATQRNGAELHENWNPASFSQQGKACIISNFHLFFFSQLITAVHGCFSEKMWLSSLSTTNGHSPWALASTRLKSWATAAADLQHLLKGVQGGEQKWGMLCSGGGEKGETGRTRLQVGLYFQEPIS